MSIQDCLKKFEDDLDEEHKKSSLLYKGIKHYSPLAVIFGTALTVLAAPFLYFSIQFSNHEFEVKAKREAGQEVLRFNEEYKHELDKQKSILDACWEQLNKEKEELCQKERDIDFRVIETDSNARIAEFDKKYIGLKEQLLQCKKDLLTKRLDKRECSLDAKEAALNEAEDKFEGMLYSDVKKSLPFYSAKIE